MEQEVLAVARDSFPPCHSDCTAVLPAGQLREHSSQTITDAELRTDLSSANSRRPRAVVRPPLDVVFAKQRFYEPPIR